MCGKCVRGSRVDQSSNMSGWKPLCSTRPGRPVGTHGALWTTPQRSLVPDLATLSPTSSSHSSR
eukprot:5712905-Prorocentrum_lima.AAC.1